MPKSGPGAAVSAASPLEGEVARRVGLEQPDQHLGDDPPGDGPEVQALMSSCASLSA